MVGGAMEPEYGELIAIEIELRIGRAGESGIANITCDPDDAVGFGRNCTVRLTQCDALANGIFAGKELAGQRLAEHHSESAASAHVGRIEGAALEQADLERSEIIG